MQNIIMRILLLFLIKIYAICESQENAFYGFGIIAGKKHIERFEFNDTDVDSIKNPVLAKFDKTLSLFFTYVSKNGNSKVILTLINCPSVKIMKKKFS